MEPLPTANTGITQFFRQWLETFAGYVREVDYASARPLFHPDPPPPPPPPPPPDRDKTKRPFQTSAASGAGVLRDRNDLKLLTGCTDYIPNSFAHQKPCHWGYEGNRTGLGVRFVLSHDTIFLYAPIVAPEGHRAAKGNSVS